MYIHKLYTNKFGFEIDSASCCIENADITKHKLIFT